MTHKSVPLFLAAAALVSFGGYVVARADDAAQAPKAKPVSDFKLADVMRDAKPGENTSAGLIAISQFKGKKNVVLFFMSEKCGTTWRYERRMGKLMQAYKPKDVEFLGVRCSANDTPESIRKFAEAKNFDMPVLNDERGEMTRFFNVRNTPTFVLLDKEGVMRYRGSFDDSAEESDVKNHYLPDAVKAVVEGKQVAVKVTRPFG